MATPISSALISFVVAVITTFCTTFILDRFYPFLGKGKMRHEAKTNTVHLALSSIPRNDLATRDAKSNEFYIELYKSEAGTDNGGWEVDVKPLSQVTDFPIFNYRVLRFSMTSTADAAITSFAFSPAGFPFSHGLSAREEYRLSKDKPLIFYVDKLHCPCSAFFDIPDYKLVFSSINEQQSRVCNPTISR